MGTAQSSNKTLISNLLLLPNIGHTQREILILLLEHTEFWHPVTNKPRKRFIAKELDVSPSVIHFALYGRKSGGHGEIGIFRRFNSNKY